ncbi:MAG TPA: Nramp family divalent metal transporter [Ignavibacteria bacterium]|nr:Nramp family divalent metal transporter [Ignavibacteria bacterium]
MKKIIDLLKSIGPGFAVAATGVGAGDMVAATVSGGKYGLIILWAIVFGAVLKYVLNEGISRWQFATGSTLLEGWIHHLHKFVSFYFIIYLFLWGFVVSAALTISCGLVFNTMFPVFSIEVWAVMHSLVTLAIIFYSKYSFFEKLMKYFVVLMFITLISCAIWINPDWGLTFKSIFVPELPEGSSKFILSVIGGVGGSVTILSYSYWIREKKWNSQSDYKKSKVDLFAAYFFTGLFCISVAIIASGISPEMVTGEKILVAVADKIQAVSGSFLRWIYLIGFWAAVVTSLIGVFQGVPYMFADFIDSYKKHTTTSNIDSKQFKKYYNWFLFYIAILPLVLLFVNRPVYIILIYTVIGALFMPFLAVTLLILNNKKTLVQGFRNPIWINIFLIISLLLFGYLAYSEIADYFSKW